MNVSLPFGIGAATWERDDSQTKAAWELYVELVTRVAVQPTTEAASLREAFESLHALFAAVRTILRAAGPDVGITKNSVGGTAIAVLNLGLRPFLSEWHPKLRSWEELRKPGSDPIAHERAWSYAKDARRALDEVRRGLGEYLQVLARASGAVAG